MRLARTRILNVDEMYDAGNTMTRVFDLIGERHTNLKGEHPRLRQPDLSSENTMGADLFKQQKLDPDQQFKIYGYEIVSDRVSLIPDPAIR